MTDETPKRPDEKDDAMTDDESDPRVPEVTRRAAMSTPAKAALGGAGVLGLLGLATDSASAQQSLEPAQVLRDSQGREIRLRMIDGDYLLEHVPSGATFSYDQSEGYWTLNTTLYLGGNDVQNVGSLDATSVSADEISITETIVDSTGAMSGGETLSFGSNNSGDVVGSPGDHIIASATPANDPGNDHGYSVDSIVWDESVSRFEIHVTETENSGGGEVNVVACRIGVS